MLFLSFFHCSGQLFSIRTVVRGKPFPVSLIRGGPPELGRSVLTRVLISADGFYGHAAIMTAGAVTAAAADVSNGFAGRSGRRVARAE